MWVVHFCEFVNLTFRIGEMRRPSGALSSTESKEVGWEAISNAPLGTASRSGLIGWVIDDVGGLVGQFYFFFFKGQFA